MESWRDTVGQYTSKKETARFENGSIENEFPNLGLDFQVDNERVWARLNSSRCCQISSWVVQQHMQGFIRSWFPSGFFSGFCGAIDSMDMFESIKSHQSIDFKANLACWSANFLC
eukprot:Sdes_comp16573_c0_seq1m5884